MVFAPARSTPPVSPLRSGSWKKMGSPVALGDDGTHLGGTLYFQPQLGRNPAIPLSGGAVAAIPYVSSTRVITGAEQAVYHCVGPVAAAINRVGYV